MTEHKSKNRPLKHYVVAAMTAVPRISRKDIVRFDAWMDNDHSVVLEQAFDEFLEMLESVSRHNIVIELPSHTVLAEMFSRFAYNSSSGALAKKRRNIVI
jgi:hypothetical protein